MAQNNFVAFGAPSQLRLQVDVESNDSVLFTVLTPFDQPMGNLHHLEVPIADIRAFCKGEAETAVATHESATLTFTPGTDESHEFFRVNYKDPDNWTDSKSSVMIHEFCALIDSLSTANAS